MTLLVSSHSLCFAALQELLIAARDSLACGLAPAAAAVPAKEAPRWTSEQFQGIVKSIVASPGGSVPRSDIYKMLGEEGPAVLRSLVDYKILALRLPSSSAEDLDPTMVAAAEYDILVCPRAASDLVIMNRWVEKNLVDVTLNSEG
jgi:hypothetical protein